MKIYQVSTGDNVYSYEKSIVVFFEGKRKVLSTSVYNGGYHENLKAVFNHDGTRGAGMSCEMLADTYDEHMKIIAQRIGLEAEFVTGMGTAANMENVAIESLAYEELQVTAIVTGGIETNGGRVGDPTTNYRTMEKPNKLGTINIMLVIDADLPPGTLARALVTCTEAKTAAIQELMAGSNYSTGLATGSGTDQTLIIANADSDLYFEGAGKHSKLGELIGKTVIKAVQQALSKQSNLNPRSQHSVLRRLKRFGVTSETLWLKYCVGETDLVIKPNFLEALDSLEKEEAMVTYCSLYIHLLDQYLWQLLSGQEIIKAGQQILDILAEKYQVQVVIIEKSAVAPFMAAVEKLIIEILQKKIQV